MVADVLTHREIEYVTYKWIGVSGGYLGDFSYRTHYEFYDEYCGLGEINPYHMPGTTRMRFEHILFQADPRTKAKILRGVLKKYPLGSAEHRTQDKYERMQEFINRCEGVAPVPVVKPAITSEVIERALADADTLLKESHPVSAVDRVHTAFHGYLKALCEARNIEYENDASTTRLFKLLRQNSDELKARGEYAEQKERIVNSFASIIDAINPLRNRGTIAHPNENLLSHEDAMLCINSVRTLFHYLNSKIRIN